MRTRLPETLVLFAAAAAAPPAAAQCPTAADGFDLDGIAPPWIMDVAVHDLGIGPELYVVGNFHGASGGVTANNVVRWKDERWHALGKGLWNTSPTLTSWVGAIERFDDGSGTELYFGGLFDRAGDVAVEGVAAWDGTRWRSVGSSLHGAVTDLHVWDDGTGRTLWAVANDAYEPSKLWKWQGTDWVHVVTIDENATPPGQVLCMADYDDGSGRALYLGGHFSEPARGLVRWDGTSLTAVGGGLDLSVASHFRPTVTTLAVWDDGTGRALYVGGQSFDRAGGVPVSGVARWRAGSWSAVGNELASCNRLRVSDLGDGTHLYEQGNRYWNGAAWVTAPGSPGISAGAWTSFDRGSGPEAVHAGSSILVGSRGIASWNGQTWRSFGAMESGVPGPPIDLKVADLGQGEQIHGMGWMWTRAWNGASWTELPNPPTPVGWIEALGVGLGGSSLLAADYLFVYRLESGVWSPLVEHSGREVRDYLELDLGNGPTLYFAGVFGALRPYGALDYFEANNVAGWNGTSWFPLGEGLNGDVFDLVGYDDGNGPALYAGGSFNAWGPPIAHVARWNGTTWLPVGAGTDGTVTAMAAFDDGTGACLFVGGDFQTAGGVASPHVACWDGQAWSAVGTGLASDQLGHRNTVTDMAVFDDGTGPALYVGGNFHTAGGVPAAHVARWDGTSWSPLGSGASHRVTALEVFDDGTGEALFIGGEFVSFDGVPSAHVARWGDRCASEESVAFCEASDDACPCGNGGDGQGGCDTPQATGGVRLELASFAPGGGTSEVATLRGTGFPSSASPAAILLRADDWAHDTAPFGDGLACLGGPGVVADVRLASGGATTHVVVDQDGTGVRYFQLRYRSNPAAFCDATAAFNTSNAFKVTW